MKFTITFKTPDAVVYAVNDLAANAQIAWEMHDTAKNFVKHGEYITIEFDTEKNTARVVPL